MARSRFRPIGTGTRQRNCSRDWNGRRFRMPAIKLCQVWLLITRRLHIVGSVLRPGSVGRLRSWSSVLRSRAERSCGQTKISLSEEEVKRGRTEVKTPHTRSEERGGGED